MKHLDALQFIIRDSEKGFGWKQKQLEWIESSAPPPFLFAVHHNLFTFNIRVKARKEENKS